MAYESEFYIPENITGYTRNLNNNPTVYFKNGNTVGYIIQQDNNSSRSMSSCGRYSVLEDPTHESSSKIVNGTERHTEFLQEEEILVASTAFHPVDDNNRTQLATAIENHPALAETQETQYRAALLSYTDGQEPAAAAYGALGVHMINATVKHLKTSRGTDQEAIVRAQCELDRLEVGHVNTSPIHPVASRYDELPLASIVSPEEGQNRNPIATPGIVIPYRGGHPNQNIGLLPVEPLFQLTVVPRENYTEEERQATEATFDPLNGPQARTHIMPMPRNLSAMTHPQQTTRTTEGCLPRPRVLGRLSEMATRVRDGARPTRASNRNRNRA